MEHCMIQPFTDGVEHLGPVHTLHFYHSVFIVPYHTVQLQYGNRMLTAHIVVKKVKTVSYCDILCSFFYFSFV